MGEKWKLFDLDSLRTEEKSKSSEEELSENEVSGTDEKSKSSKEEVHDTDNTDSSDQSSPRGVLENSISSMDSDSGSTGDPSCLERSSSLHWRSLIGGLLLRRRKSIRRFSTFPPLLPPEHMRIGTEEDQQTGSGLPQEEILKGRPSWRSFSYSELAAATDNFSPGCISFKFIFSLEYCNLRRMLIFISLVLNKVSGKKIILRTNTNDIQV